MFCPDFQEMLSQGLILYSNTHELSFNETSETSSILSSYSNRISSVSLQRLLSRFLSANRLAVSLSVFRKQYFSECSPYRLNIGRSIGFFITIRERKHEKTMDSLKKHTEDLMPELKKWSGNPSIFSIFPNESLVVMMREHIRTGYQELWDILEGRDGIKVVESSYYVLVKKTAGQIETFIEKQHLERIPKFEIENLDWFIQDIKDFLEKKLYDNKSYTFVVVTDSAILDTYIINSVRSDGTINRAKYLSGTKENLEKIAEIMNHSLNDAQLQQMIRTLHDLGQQLYSKRETYKKKMNMIIHNITYGVSDEDKILLGKCDRCRNIKQKQKID
jgi:hypothetical protein